MRLPAAVPAACVLVLVLGACDSDSTRAFADVGTDATTDSVGTSTPDVSAQDVADLPPGDGPVVLSINPSTASVRGGEVLTLRGARLPTDVTLSIAGQPVALVSQSTTNIVFVTPPLPLGPTGLELAAGEWSVRVTNAFTVEPLDLMFATEVVDSLSPSGAESINDAIGFDVEKDGDVDLVLATNDGLRVYLNDGLGRFELLRQVSETVADPPAQSPGGSFDARALISADVTGDDIDELLICTGSGRDVLMQASSGGLTDAPALPIRGGSCVDGKAISVNGDERPDFAWLVETAEGSVIMVLVAEETGALAYSQAVSPAAIGSHDIGQTSSDGTTFMRVDDDASGGIGAGRMTFSVPNESKTIFTLPAPISTLAPLSLRLKADNPVTVVFRATDSAGTPFDSPPVVTSINWKTYKSALDVWAKDAVMPLVSLGFVIAGPAAGIIRIDDLVTGDTKNTNVINDFEERSFSYSWPKASGLVVGDLDGDDLDDLVVLTPGDVPILMTEGATDGPWVAGLAPVTGPFTDGRVLDSPAQNGGDRRVDVVLISSEGQDRLFRVADGLIVDATAIALPIDYVDGRAVEVADLNLDGHDDLVIGNYGSTDRLYLGTDDGRLADFTPALGFDTSPTIAIVVVDVDADGDLDVLSIPHSGDQPPSLRISAGGSP